MNKLEAHLSDFDGFEALLGEITDFSSAGIRPGLRRISRLLSLLGEPQRRAPTIQILGTNGKGSTAATIEAMLRAGTRTALYTSPHLISLQERLRIDGRYAPLDDWRAVWKKIAALVDGDHELSEDKPSFFEHFTALCMELTREAGATSAILEAGMGGRYDATSVCDPLAVMINPIGMDHTQYLGGTIEEIAEEKFAATREGRDAFYAGDDEKLTAIFKTHCDKIGATPRILDDMARPVSIRCGMDGTKFTYSASGEIGGVSEITNLSTPLLGAHQARNAARAITVLLALREKFDMLSFLTPDSIRESLARVDWPGRMEIIREPGGGAVMLAGSHNEHAVRALVSSLEAMESGEKIGAIVLAVMGDKDIPPILRALADLRVPVHCAELPMERCAMASDLANMARVEGLSVGGVHASPEKALDAARRNAKDGEMILCCGSLYLVGYVRKILLYG